MMENFAMGSLPALPIPAEYPSTSNSLAPNMNMSSEATAIQVGNLAENNTSLVPFASARSDPPTRRADKPKGRRGRKPRQVGRIIKNPDWLPPGWITEIKIRDGGVSHGGIDRFFYDPVSNHRFRSKREVLNFLETGRLRHQVLKQKKEALNGKALEKPPSAAGSKSRTGLLPSSRQGYGVMNGASSCRSAMPTLSLSHQMPNASQRPAQNGAETLGTRKTRKVRWVLVSSEGSWEPHIGDDETNGPSPRDMESAFDLNCNSADGHHRNLYLGIHFSVFCFFCYFAYSIFLQFSAFTITDGCIRFLAVSEN
eukprot:TRINITY_DN3385_c0_g1_i2.p1 TRINITY_DN3385_c0_g1~~TRINITY_DN3385_c0_g1_i2.p1  ORF type:complete len:311 (+),score=52.44 TRINITY_DN3385_c0_g1_i2:228-1160(+)